MSAAEPQQDGDAESWDDETRRVVEHLDAENEHLRRVVDELRDLLEEAVTREVALERHVAVLEARLAILRRISDVLMITRLVRFGRRKGWIRTPTGAPHA